MWVQNYQPVLGSVILSAIVAGLPLYVLFCLLAIKQWKAHWAALSALSIALLVAVLLFGMPVPLALSSATMGVVFGLFPILWIVLNALFIYDLTVETGKFDIVRQSIASVSVDQRIQVLLIAFCFGALIEGIAGFGTPVALSAAMLVGLGFAPRAAVMMALLANTAPVAFGNLGIPIISLAGVIDPFLGVPREQLVQPLSAMVGRQIPLLSFAIPGFLIVILAGWRRMLEVLPAVLVAGGGFATTQLAVSNLLGPVLADVAAALIGLAALLALLRVWHPKETLVLTHRPAQGLELDTTAYSLIVLAWLPFIILVVVIVIGSIPEVAGVLDQATIRFPWPGLHNQVLKAPPLVVPEAADALAASLPAVFTFDWLKSAGTLTLFAGLLSARVLGVAPRRAVEIYVHTIAGLRGTIVTVTSVLGVAWVMNYSGLTIVLGLVLTFTGLLFPFFSAFIGWIGVFLTGSDTASNNLFGGLQVTAAQQTGVSPILTSATNSSGGVCGKMISPQNLSIGAAAVGVHGEEGQIFRRTFLWSLLLVSFVGLLALIQAFLIPAIVPPV
ncbi:MAG: L-lactate permease [Chloroflexi bacterium]|nr:L-lactate permease [Chloroflexota bacterium]